jgi:hypothetical protein
MKKITLLAELNCLNKLVNGKVVVLNLSEGRYTTYNPGRFTPKMPETFNPEDYALMETDYCPIVIEATPRMKEEYLVNKAWKEQCNNSVTKYINFKRY